MVGIVKAGNESIEAELKHKIDFKTKPIGSLGMLEEVALQMGYVQQTLTPKVTNPHLIVFAGDHGLAKDGVSAFPQEVTHQMVHNFLNGGAAINVFCRQHKIDLKVVDAGVNHDFGTFEGLIDAKVDFGTKSALTDRAMSMETAKEALLKGMEVVEEHVSKDCTVIGFGEMGIGNTSSAALIMHYVTGKPIEDCVGKGTGVETIDHKLEVLKKVVDFHGEKKGAFEILSAVGGFEIAQMAGAFICAARLGMTVVVDGFITTAAYAIAQLLEPNLSDYALFAHQSDEKGHRDFLAYLGAKPLLSLGLRLGEGTGAALAFPLIKSAVDFLNEMASFESAGVSNS